VAKRKVEKKGKHWAKRPEEKCKPPKKHKKKQIVSKKIFTFIA